MKKKTLVFNLTPRMGMLHYSAQFCNELANQGYDVKVAIASYYNGDIYDDTIDFLKLTTNPTIFSFLKDSLNLFQHIGFIKKIKKFNPDIIHFMDNHPWYIIYGKLLKFLGYKIYVTQHDPILHSGENKTLLGRISNITNKIFRLIADKLIVHGDILKQQVIDQYSYDQKKIVSIPHGNYNFFTRWANKIKIKKNTFLFFGRIVDYKGLDILLESLSFVKEKIDNFTLIIAGSGSLEKYIPLLEKHKDVIDIYNEDIPDEEVYMYVGQSEFMVLPYKDATGSGVIPLAYAFSKAVITTDVGELATHVHHKKSGIIVLPNNPHALAGAIIWMLHHKNEVEAMGVEGKKYTEDVLGWDKIVRKIYN